MNGRHPMSPVNLTTAALALSLGLWLPACAGGPDTAGSDQDSGTQTDGAGIDAGAQDPDSAVDAGGAADSGPADSGADDAASGDSGAGDAGGAGDAAGGADGGDGTGELSWAQRFDLVFPTDHVVNLELDFPDGGWLKLLTDWDTKEQKVLYPAALKQDTAVLAKVGARLKGLSSLPWSDGPIQPWRKYPLKVDYDAFDGPSLHGVDKISLGNTGQDLSFMRERLAARLYKAMGVPAPRTSYARLTIDGHYIGVYVMMQVINKQFLKEHYGTDQSADDGNLYKCVHNGKGVCDLSYRGKDKASYRLTDSCQPSYEACGLVLKTHEDDPQWNDYGDLVHLLDVLNNTPLDQLESKLPEVLDVESFLRTLAVTFTMSSYDSYLGKSNNFYLYHRPTDGRFEMLPWDFDGAYNGLYCQDLDNPTCGDLANYPLVGRVLSVPAWKASYRATLKQLLQAHFTVDNHKSWIAEFDALVGPLVGGDPNYSKDFGYYKQITATTPSAGNTENLLTFVAQRRADLLKKLAAP